MKARFLLLSALALVFSGTSLMAQSASVSSSATIETPISATANAALAFGTISKGATASVAATSGDAAAVMFSGDESDNITVSVPATATISTTSGAGASMTVSITRASLRAHTSNVQASASALDASSGTATTALSADAGGNGSGGDGLGQAYVWIGGSVTPAATQQRGVYSGTFTVSAAYSN